MPLGKPSVKAGSAWEAVQKAPPQPQKPSTMLQELESFERSVAVIQAETFFFLCVRHIFAQTFCSSPWLDLLSTTGRQKAHMDQSIWS